MPRRLSRSDPMTEPGLHLHEWETQWQQLRDESVDEPVTAQGDDADIVRDFLAAREIHDDIAQDRAAP
jgi:hypothetical protein